MTGEYHKCPYCHNLLNSLQYHQIGWNLDFGTFKMEREKSMEIRKQKFTIIIADMGSTEKYLCGYCHGLIAISKGEATRFLLTGSCCVNQ